MDKIDNFVGTKDRLEEYSESKWISVNDKLPEMGKAVLTCDKDYRIFLCNMRSSGFKVHWTVWDHNNVTHWMALPELPKESK